MEDGDLGLGDGDALVCGTLVCGAACWDAEAPMLGGMPQIMQ